MTTLHTASYRAWTPGLGSPVVTSLTIPKWIAGAADWPRLWAVTPRWAYFRAEPGEFARAYRAQLSRYGARRIARELAAIARETDTDRLVLLCWEVDWQTCHRGLWAEWWLLNVGERIAEIP